MKSKDEWIYYYSNKNNNKTCSLIFMWKKIEGRGKIQMKSRWKSELLNSHLFFL